MNQDKYFEDKAQEQFDEGVICPCCENRGVYCPYCEGVGFVPKYIKKNYIKEQKKEKDYEPIGGDGTR